MCVGSSPVTSEMMSATTGALDAAARRPPWIADRCLRTVFISWIAAPLRKSSRVTRDPARCRFARLVGHRVPGLDHADSPCRQAVAVAGDGDALERVMPM